MQDRLFWHFIGSPGGKGSVGHSIVCMVDGHNGDASAKFLEQRLGVALEKHMPSGHVSKSFNTIGVGNSIEMCFVDRFCYPCFILVG